MELLNYIDGEFRKGIKVQTNIDVLNRKTGPKLKVHFASHWDIVSAIEGISRVQSEIAKIDEKIIHDVLHRAMKYYLVKKSDYTLLAEMTGSPVRFTEAAINETKEWVMKSEEFSKAVFGHKLEAHHNSVPSIGILPSNSEQEALYVIVQSLLAKSAMIIRPSSRGAAGYSSLEFVHAWNRAVDEIASEHIFLKKIISVINISDMNQNWGLLSIDNWNYVCFGSDATIHEIKKEIYTHAQPRKIIAYGSGLSMTAVDESNETDLNDLAYTILESVSINRGNECVSTDILYVHKSLYDKFNKILLKTRDQFKSLSVNDKRTIGLTQETNCDYILNAIAQKGKLEYIDFEEKGFGNNKRKVIHTSIVPLTEHEASMEYPGPIVSMRSYSDQEHLFKLMRTDLLQNNKRKSLVCSLYSSKEFFNSSLASISAYKIKHNRPTHLMDLFLPHQGIYLMRQLSDIIVLERG